MKRLCCSRFISILFLMTGLLLAGTKAPKSVAIYYDTNPPAQIFSLFDWVIVDPSSVEIENLDTDSKVIAYLSVGESYIAEDEIKIGENRDWNSHIVDLRIDKVREDLLKKAKTLKEFDGFMLDTLDSYQIALKDKKARAEYEEALVKFVKKLRKEFPNKIIITNRGFEIYDRIQNEIDAFLVESLYSGINTVDKSIRAVSIADRNWLLPKLKKIAKSKPVIVVDYMEPPFLGAEELAKKIAAEGFIPYIADPHLKHIGVSTVRYVPRDVLILYMSDLPPNESEAHSLFSMPIEYLGFVPRLWNLSKGLPKTSIFDRYAGIVVALEQRLLNNEREFFDWIESNIKQGVKVLFINGFGFENPELFERLGLEMFQIQKSSQSKILLAKEAEYETKPNFFDSQFLLKGKELKPVAAIEREGAIFALTGYTPWGGFALPGGAVVNLFNYDLWAVDPFTFFKKALTLPDIPVPDTTTENGRRILFSHIDGDGFIEKAFFDGGKYAAEVLFEKVLKKYPIPHSISVIEAEIAPWGLYPKESAKLEEIAKKIFSLSYVEPASHSFSHPFKWSKSEQNIEGYNLKIKGYSFDLKREILGSVKYVNSLLPKDKKCRLFFWTGDCLPSKEALKICYDNRILNINGGDTVITDENPWLSLVAPLGLYRGDYFQVYCAIQNENIFTDEWTNYGGYVKAIEAFKRTEYPKRLKPIDIYYHFYSASKKASLNALHRVYRWALGQKVNPMFASMWIKRVLDFENLAVAKDLEGDWIVVTNKNLKTLRTQKPISDRSENVLGYKYRKNSGYYIHLNEKGRYRISYKGDKPDFRLVEANGIVQKSGENFVKLRSFVPIYAKFEIKNGCEYNIYPRGVKVSKKGSYVTIKSNSIKEVRIETGCKR